MQVKNESLSDAISAFSPASKPHAERFPLREIEETEKGHWVAFVDEGSESYDVQFVVNKAQLASHSCNC
jgi:hypothetical protein